MNPSNRHHDRQQQPTAGEEDPVRRFLREHGSADFVVRGGLEGLLSAWERTAAELARGAAADGDDYLNDADARQILEEALRHALPGQRESVRRRLDILDERLKHFLSPPSACLWGEKAARENGWTAERNWWYFRRPRGFSG